MNMLAFYRIKAMINKEFKQLSRDRITFAMIIMIPLIQLLLFGYAINLNVRHIPVGVLDHSQTYASRILLEDIKQTQVVDVVDAFTNAQDAQQALQSGEVRAVLILPQDMLQCFEQGRVLGQWLIDGSDAAVSASLLALEDFPFRLNPKNIAPHVKTAQSDASFAMTLLYNPSRKSSTSIIPGLIGVILTMTTVLFTSIAIAKEREQGNFELLITTPIRPLEIMLAKILPYILIGLIQVSILLFLGSVLFNMPINGPLGQVYCVALLFICASLSLGLIISTLAKTQLQAVQLTLFILLPSILLSGFMFPYEGMPVAAQWLAEAIPMTHFVRMIRGVILRGADIWDLYKDALWLAGFTLFGIAFAAIRFNKSLD